MGATATKWSYQDPPINAHFAGCLFFWNLYACILNLRILQLFRSYWKELEVYISEEQQTKKSERPTLSQFYSLMAHGQVMHNARLNPASICLLMRWGWGWGWALH